MGVAVGSQLSPLPVLLDFYRTKLESISEKARGVSLHLSVPSLSPERGRRLSAVFRMLDLL